MADNHDHSECCRPHAPIAIPLDIPLPRAQDPPTECGFCEEGVILIKRRMTEYTIECPYCDQGGDALT